LRLALSPTVAIKASAPHDIALSALGKRSARISKLRSSAVGMILRRGNFRLVA
jgi:hypothetical protein